MFMYVYLKIFICNLICSKLIFWNCYSFGYMRSIYKTTEININILKCNIQRKKTVSFLTHENYKAVIYKAWHKDAKYLGNYFTFLRV